MKGLLAKLWKTGPETWGAKALIPTIGAMAAFLAYIFIQIPFETRAKAEIDAKIEAGPKLSVTVNQDYDREEIIHYPPFTYRISSKLTITNHSPKIVGAGYISYRLVYAHPKDSLASATLMSGKSPLVPAGSSIETRVTLEVDAEPLLTSHPPSSMLLITSLIDFVDEAGRPIEDENKLYLCQTLVRGNVRQDPTDFPERICEVAGFAEFNGSNNNGVVIKDGHFEPWVCSGIREAGFHEHFCSS